ncbi:hypothetical protein Nepgr_012910 [Nepenthes gracilis]|uniref:Uncharacterized protein n=1 Tax=Nepenthes gracilis TaxID=150966 RepID=A0AAD3XNM1_NEPGR|nr:hypothetical protein Nepgr_012910 [Nepenthes gracilis]
MESGLQIRTRNNREEGDGGKIPQEPVTPTGQYFNSSVLSVAILGILEFEVAIDDSPAMSLLRDVFLPINPRFSSIMVLSFSYNLPSETVITTASEIIAHTFDACLL